MFNLFKKKDNSNNGKENKSLPQMADLNNNILKEGDIVMSLRYDLGKCRIILIEGAYYYESLESGEKVSWAKMVDASTDLQKVKKL